MLRYLSLWIIVFVMWAEAIEIDKFDPKAPLVENFSTNCLQMTQSQQILKAYIMVGLHSNFQNPEAQLKKAVEEYDKRAEAMRRYFHQKLGKGNAEAKAAFDEAFRLWRESKKMLEATPTPENALKIRENLLKMIQKLLEGTKPLATPDLELISLTGKLCRKPIEITNAYLMHVWGHDIPDYEKEVKRLIDNFYVNLETLKKNPLNNEESLKLLDETKRQFLFFKIMYNSKRRFIPNLLSIKADKNFKVIRQVKKIYKREAESHAEQR